MAVSDDTSDSLRDQVRSFWERESCGERYGAGEDYAYYAAQAAERYRLEPWIEPFARFHEGRDQRVLEIGVGMGADYERWLAAGAEAHGVDLTNRGLLHATRRCQLAGYTPRLTQCDAQHLPFETGSFDLVYSWGVLHHAPNPPQIFSEVARVLRPGGIARIAVYHYPCWGAWLIWGKQALLRGKPFQSVRAVVANHMESPGTKLYTVAEGRAMCGDFSRVLGIRTQLGLGDLLTMKPSEKYQDLLSQMVIKFYPRWLIRRLGHRFGGYLLLECQR